MDPSGLKHLTSESALWVLNFKISFCRCCCFFTAKDRRFNRFVRISSGVQRRKFWLSLTRQRTGVGPSCSLKKGLSFTKWTESCSCVWARWGFFCVWSHKLNAPVWLSYQSRFFTSCPVLARPRTTAATTGSDNKKWTGPTFVILNCSDLNFACL